MSKFDPAISQEFYAAHNYHFNNFRRKTILVILSSKASSSGIGLHHFYMKDCHNNREMKQPQHCADILQFRQLHYKFRVSLEDWFVLQFKCWLVRRASRAMSHSTCSEHYNNFRILRSLHALHISGMPLFLCAIEQKDEALIQFEYYQWPRLPTLCSSRNKIYITCVRIFHSQKQCTSNQNYFLYNIWRVR